MRAPRRHEVPDHVLRRVWLRPDGPIRSLQAVPRLQQDRIYAPHTLGKDLVEERGLDGVAANERECLRHRLDRRAEGEVVRQLALADGV
jgi:hypothetical protein